MKKRIQKILPILFMVLVFVFVIIITAKTIFASLDNLSSGNIELREAPDPLTAELSNMVNSYKNGEIDAIDISDLTTFSWDWLYLFGEYSQPSEIDSIVGRSWRKNCYTDISVSDGYSLLVFVENGVVVHCLDYPKSEGNFLISDQIHKNGISSQEASFVVDKYGMLIWTGDK
jgi:hypothetical protein